ncbi:hypothetical protein QR97_25425 [Streptomyces sp. PBH53]|nr:hypothetical protein QR97_25425 [Streptomyces sp. PBH53]
MYIAPAQMPRAPRRSPSTAGWPARKVTAWWMSRTLRAGFSTSRGSPSDSPKPVKSKDSAAYPRAASRSAYRSAICSFTLVQVPATTMPGSGPAASAPSGKNRLAVRVTPSLSKATLRG